jgi:hypothetical protein
MTDFVAILLIMLCFFVLMALVIIKGEKDG